MLPGAYASRLLLLIGSATSLSRPLALSVAHCVRIPRRVMVYLGSCFCLVANMQSLVTKSLTFDVRIANFYYNFNARTEAQSWCKMSEAEGNGGGTMHSCFAHCQ